jgi:hypothetical protein
MIDTNSISQIAQVAPQVQNALNAWHVVALGAGAYLAHAYHSIKAAGGIKTILQCLWSGDYDIKAESENRESGNAEDANSSPTLKSKIENQKSPST